MEEALLPWLEEEEKRLLPKTMSGSKFSEPETIAELVQQNYYVLKQNKIKNLDAIAEGRKPPKPDLMRIGSILGMEFTDLQELTNRSFPKSS